VQAAAARGSRRRAPRYRARITLGKGDRLACSANHEHMSYGSRE